MSSVCSQLAAWALSTQFYPERKAAEAEQIAEMEAGIAEMEASVSAMQADVATAMAALESATADVEAARAVTLDPPAHCPA